MAGQQSQRQAILAHLRTVDPDTGERNTLSPLEAFALYKVQRLASRVEELRRDGHPVRTTIRRDQTGKRYARYSLSADEDTTDEV